MELAEVYRIVYKGPLNRLRGIIVSEDQVNGYQFLFKGEIPEVLKDDIVQDDTLLKDSTYEAYDTLLKDCTYEAYDTLLKDCTYEAYKDADDVNSTMLKYSTYEAYKDADDVNSTMLKYSTYEAYKDADKQRVHLYEELYPFIEHQEHVIPNSRIESSIRAKDKFSLSLYLFGTVYENVVFEYPYDQPEKLSTPLTKKLVSEDGSIYLKVLYTIFNHAVEAIIEVTLISNSHLFGFHGVIAARTSAIEHPAYSSLIFYAKPENESSVYPGKNIIIPLSRNIVAVPLGHQLILEFGLTKRDYVEEGGVKAYDEMVKNYLIFNALEDGKSIKSINSSKGEVKVEVTWRSPGST